MFYFKDPVTGEVYAYDNEQVTGGHVRAGLIAMTPEEVVEHLNPPLTPVDLIAYAAQKRWEKEVGGTEVAGMPIFTDDRSKTLIMGARQAADADPGFTTQWKTAGGTFITLDATMIMAISNAVLAHVAACFVREAAVIAAIEGETITTTAEIDDAFDAVEWPAA